MEIPEMISRLNSLHKRVLQSGNTEAIKVFNQLLDKIMVESSPKTFLELYREEQNKKLS